MADLQKAIAAATDAVSDLIPANQQFGGPTRALALLTAWIREATAAYERNVEQMTAEDRHAIDVAKRLCTLDHGHDWVNELVMGNAGIPPPIRRVPRAASNEATEVVSVLGCLAGVVPLWVHYLPRARMLLDQFDLRIGGDDG